MTHSAMVVEFLIFSTRHHLTACGDLLRTGIFIIQLVGLKCGSEVITLLEPQIKDKE